MKRTVFVILVYFTGFRFVALAQGNRPAFIDGDISFSAYMGLHAHIDDLPLCERELVFVRFKIDQEGQVRDISFSQHTDSLLKVSLRNALESTSGKWRPGTDSHSLNKYLVLPCLVGIENSCNQQVIDAYFKSGDSVWQALLRVNHRPDSLPPSYNVHPPKKRTLSDYWAQKSFASMSNLTFFEDGDPGFPLDCILLQQIDFVYLH